LVIGTYWLSHIRTISNTRTMCCYLLFQNGGPRLKINKD
jgi:hypothetical protein